MPVPTGGACGSMKKMSCEDCKFYYDGRTQNNENAKCVWIPSQTRCRSMGSVIKRRKTQPDYEFDEFCTGKYVSLIIMHGIESDRITDYN